MEPIPPPNGLMPWLACAMFVLFLCEKAINFSRRFKGTPPNETLDTNHAALKDRVAGTEKEIELIWLTLRAENADIRKEIRDSVVRIERALGRVEGHLQKDEEKK